MTYQGEPTRSNSTILKVLVVVTIVWVAYWASTGGLDRIVVPETAPVTSTTLAE